MLIEDWEFDVHYSVSEGTILADKENTINPKYQKWQEKKEHLEELITNMTREVISWEKVERLEDVPVEADEVEWWGNNEKISTLYSYLN